MIPEQFNEVSSLNNTEFNLFIHHNYYWFCHFSGHLNRHNHDFLVLCDAYVYTVPFLLRTINVLIMNVRILIGHSYSSLQFISVSMSHIFNFIYCYGFDFDCIYSIELQCLIQFYFILT